MFAVEREGSIARLEIRDFRVIERLVGKHVFPAFVRMFNGVDRLDALFHFYALNEQHVDDRNHPQAAARNGWTIQVLMCGAFYECVDALRLLNKAGVAAQIREDSEVWALLKGMLREWERDPILKKVRHGFAHHLGDSEQIEAGLDLFRSGKTMTIFDAKGGPFPNGCVFPFVMDVLLHGSGILESDFLEFIERAVRHQVVLRLLLTRLFVEVLVFHGVELEVPDQHPGVEHDVRRRR